jgi:hypothetical protein
MSGAQLLSLVGLAMGIGALAIGFGALMFPENTSASFGVKVKGDAAVYVRVTGARDVFIGLVFLYSYAQENLHTLAFLSFATSFVSACDFLITRKYGSKLISLAHLGATFALLVYGFLLLRSSGI